MERSSTTPAVERDLQVFPTLTQFRALAALGLSPAAWVDDPQMAGSTTIEGVAAVVTGSFSLSHVAASLFWSETKYVSM